MCLYCKPIDIELLNLQLEMKAKLMEARHHEEKLKLQQKHDSDVQKVQYVGNSEKY